MPLARESRVKGRRTVWDEGNVADDEQTVGIYLAVRTAR